MSSKNTANSDSAQRFADYKELQMLSGEPETQSPSEQLRVGESMT